MRKLTTIIRAHRFVCLLLIVTLFGILSGAGFAISRRAKRHSSQRPTHASVVPIINNKTQTIQVVEAERVTYGNIPVLRVKVNNNANKDIKVLTIECGNAEIIDNRILGDVPITAGSSTTETIPLTDEQSNAAVPTITIKAVLFSDGTGDGDDATVQSLSDEWAGARDQAKHVLNQLLDLSKTSDPDVALSKLRSDVAALPTTTAGARSHHYEQGLKTAKERVLAVLKEMDGLRQSNSGPYADRALDRLIKVYQSLANAQSN